MTYNKFLATEISGLKDPTYASGGASKHYVDATAGAGFTVTNYMTSANTISRFYPSSLGHFYTGSGSKFHSSYLSSNKVLDTFNHTLYIASSTGISRFYDSEADLTALLNDNYAGSSNINRTLLNSISSNLDTRIDSLFNWSSNALTKYGASSHTHDDRYYTETEVRTNYYPSSLGKSLMNFSANKSLYPASSLVNRSLINSISSNIDTRVDSIFGYSSNARNIYYYSSLGHFHTGSGAKYHSAYLSGQRVFDLFNHTLYIQSGTKWSDLTDLGETTLHTHPGMTTDVAWSGAYQFTAVSGMVKVLDTWYDISSSKLSHAYVSTSTGKFEPTLTKGTLTATSPITLNDSTRQLIGGAAAISISNYIGSTQSIARFADSSNIRERFVASSVAIIKFYDSESDLTTLLNDNYAGSSNINRNLLNSISSNLDTRVDSLFNFSSNKGLYYPSTTGHFFTGSGSKLTSAYQSGQRVYDRFDHILYVASATAILKFYDSESDLTTLLNDNYPGSSNINRALLNSISSNLDARIDSIFGYSSNARNLYADSSNVRFRFQASSLARQSYLHSANQAIHSFNAANYITSTNSIARFADSGNVRVRFVQSGGTKWTALTNGGDITNVYHVHSQYGGGTTPGGGTDYVQYNKAGSFTGDSSFTWNETTNTLRISGSISGAYISAGTIKGASLTIGDVSNTEFGYLNGVTSAIQTQLDLKASIASYIASTTAISKFYPSTLGKSLMDFSSNKSLYANSANVRSRFPASSTAISRFKQSSGVWIFASSQKISGGSLRINSILTDVDFNGKNINNVNTISGTTGNNIKWQFGYLDNGSSFITHDNSDVQSNFLSILGYVSESQVAEVVVNYDGNDVDFRVASKDLSYLFNVDASLNKIGVNKNSPFYLLDVNGGIYGIGISSNRISGGVIKGNWEGNPLISSYITGYIASSTAISKFAPSTLTLQRYNQYVGHSGNTSVHTTIADEAKWNDIAGSGVKYTWAYNSWIASGNEVYAAYKHSANTGIHSFNIANYITSTTAINRFYPSTTGKATSGSVHNLWNWSSNKSWYANSSNVRSRFQASSLSYASYTHSANKSLHDTFTFNMGMVRLSANQAIKVGGFQMASSQNLYVWKACCVDSGGRSQGDLWIQVGSGQRGQLNGGKFTNIYKTSSNKIQKGNPLATYATSKDGTNIIVRMMYSGTGVTPGGWVAGQNGRFGSSWMELSTY